MNKVNLSQPSYLRFRDIFSERVNQIVIWCGAGLSAPAKLPTWGGLKHKLINELEVKWDNLTLSSDEKEKCKRTLDRIKNEQDFWRAFEALKKDLGQTTYAAAIRSALSISQKSDPPASYQKIWSLKPKGLLNLNLDKFATRAFNASFSSSQMAEFNGRNAGNYAHVLKGSSHFIANLHGVLDDESSWIFTSSEIKSLLGNSSYRNFIDSVFSTKTVLFLGTSADDIAVGGLLGDLRRKGTNPGTHFWLTSRSDKKTDDWAQKNGIEVILYDSSAGHEDPLNEILTDLEKFKPKDEEPQPIVPPVFYSGIEDISHEEETPEVISRLSPEKIRQFLCAKARQILSRNSFKEYEEFCRSFSKALHFAWFIDINAPDNILFGHRILKKIGQGAFGTVYSALSPNNEEVAIKLLRQEVKDNQAMLGSFRRGVRSMEILKNKSIEGMVPYKEAYELPPCVVMDLIHGPDLEQVVNSRRLDLWHDGIRVICEAANILHKAHLLPERVLHRDLRPANIMIKGFNDPTELWSVVVLDFDLSWHLGATEKSIVDFSAGEALGYLAPEQLDPKRVVSTRNTAVDSYGLCMTAFFIFSGQHPRPGAALAADWKKNVQEVICRTNCESWKSAGKRLARLIIRGTKQLQHERLDMSQLRNELEQLQEAIIYPERVGAPDLWAEELAHRAFSDLDCNWEDDSGGATLASPTGWKITIKGNQSSLSVEVLLEWMNLGSHDRRNVSTFARNATQQSTKILEKGEWKVRNIASSKEENIKILASFSINKISLFIDKLSRSLREQRDLVQCG